MAGFVFRGNTPTVRVIGQEIIDPAERWTWQTTPSGIAYSLVFAPIPPPQGSQPVWTAEAINQQAQEWADILEGLLANPSVSGVYQTQEVDDAQQLHDFVNIVVRSSSALSSRTIQERQENLLPPSTVGDDIAATAQTLDAIEAG